MKGLRLRRRRWAAVWCGPRGVPSPSRLNATPLVALFANDRWAAMPTPNCRGATYIIKSPQRGWGFKEMFEVSLRFSARKHKGQAVDASPFCLHKELQKTQVHWNSLQPTRQFIVCLCSVYRVKVLSLVKLLSNRASKLLHRSKSPVCSGFPTQVRCCTQPRPWAVCLICMFPCASSVSVCLCCMYLNCL